MNIEELRNYCLSKKGVEETFPFGEDTLVFKVMNKVFALTSISEGDAINLKCDPVKAIELREQYAEIVPGYHMNKKHWNTISIGESLSERFIKDLIDHSYNLVVEGLPKKEQEKLKKVYCNS